MVWGEFNFGGLVPLLLIPVVLMAALRASGVKLPFHQAIPRWILISALGIDLWALILASTQIGFGLPSFEDLQINLRFLTSTELVPETVPLIFFSAYFIALYCCLFWLKWTASAAAILPDWPYVKSPMPWFFIPCIFLLVVVGIEGINLSGLLLPLAIWLGVRYRRTGFSVIVFGAWPLFVGLRFSESWQSLFNPAYYILCLAVCRAAGQVEWLEQCLKRFGSNHYLVPILFIALPIWWEVGDEVRFGWYGRALWIFGAFLSGLLLEGCRSLAVWGSIIISAAILAQMAELPLNIFERELFLGFTLDSPFAFLTIWFSVGLGRLTRQMTHHLRCPGRASITVAERFGLVHNTPDQQPNRIADAPSRKSTLPPRHQSTTTTERWRGRIAATTIVTLALAFYPMTLPLASISFEFGVYPLTAYLASIVTGVALGHRGVELIVVTGLVICVALFPLEGLEPFLRGASGLIACVGCAWVGAYLAALTVPPVLLKVKKA